MVLISACTKAPPGYGDLESDFQRAWCLNQPGGEMEVWLSPESRADCITATHAVEFDWARKWRDCLEQAGRYGDESGKDSMCILIKKKESDQKYIDRAKQKIERDHLPIEIRTMTKDDL